MKFLFGLTKIQWLKWRSKFELQSVWQKFLFHQKLLFGSIWWYFHKNSEYTVFNLLKDTLIESYWCTKTFLSIFFLKFHTLLTSIFSPLKFKSLFRFCWLHNEKFQLETFKCLTIMNYLLHEHFLMCTKNDLSHIRCSMIWLVQLFEKNLNKRIRFKSYGDS